MDVKKQAIGEAIKSLNKKYGATTIIKMEDVADIKVIPIDTGSISLNKVFGCGGLPRGRIVELFGENSSGKSSMALFFAAQVQKTGGTVVWIDAEHSFDASYSEKIGVDVKNLLVSQPDTAEEVLDIISNMASSGAVDLIVIDSVAAMVPKKEFEGNIEDETMALLARVMSRGMNLVSGIVSKTQTCVIFINQIRDKVGVFWGQKTVTPGGKALKFFASVRLEVKKGKQIKQGDDVVGNRIEITAVKNKVGFPFKVAELDLIFEKGIDVVSDLLDCAVSESIIKLTGRTYEYGDIKLGSSRDLAKKFLEENKEVFDKIKNDITDVTRDTKIKKVADKDQGENTETEEEE